jgi:hypothetical protein
VKILADALRPLSRRLHDAAKAERACWPKEQHRSQGAAEAQVRSLVKRGLEKDLQAIHAYRCPHCDFFHVGHSGAVYNERRRVLPSL